MEPGEHLRRVFCHPRDGEARRPDAASARQVGRRVRISRDCGERPRHVPRIERVEG